MRINDVVITAISNLFRVYICWKFIRFFFDERKVEARTEKAVYFIFYIGTLLFFVCLQSHGINLIVNLAGIFLLTLIYKGSLKKKGSCINLYNELWMRYPGLFPVPEF